VRVHHVTLARLARDLVNAIDTGRSDNLWRRYRASCSASVLWNDSLGLQIHTGELAKAQMPQ